MIGWYSTTSSFRSNANCSADTMSKRRCAALRSAWSKISARPRPRCLARYMAASASRRRLSGVDSPSATDTPMLAVTRISWCSTDQGSLTATRTVDAMTAVSAGLMSSQTITNSSPPMRETVSPGRTECSIRAATLRRSWSPTSCPIESLTNLKWSMSSNSTLSVEPRRRAPASPCTSRSVRSARLASPVSGSCITCRAISDSMSLRSVVSCSCANT